MDNVKAVCCNWTRIGGSEWSQAIQTQFVDDEIIKPETDELLKDENAILLRRKMQVDHDKESSYCELELSLCPRFKISALIIVCTVPKVEIFIGAQNEYYETEHGNLVDDCQVEEMLDDPAHLRSYRYDIEIEKSGVTELILKFLTADDEICIFAILLQIAPNPNGVTTLLPNAINLENVKKMLENSSQKLTPNAEKCKNLLEIFSKQSALQTGLSLPKTTLTTMHKPTEDSGNEAIFNNLKTHIDDRMQELETKMTARMDAFQTQQSAKLDEILKAVQALNKT